MVPRIVSALKPDTDLIAACYLKVPSLNFKPAITLDNSKPTKDDYPK
jgi:hypothetical protein